MGKYDNKILLVLGSNVGSDYIVEYARENGAYVIVTDYLNPEKSLAKSLADENILISTADIEKLGDLIEKRKIDGVIAGISEFNLINAMKLSEKYKLPFYCTSEQWNQIERKDCFRKLCIKHGVPCPKTFYIGEKPSEEDWDMITYPALIKPVDGSSSLGVHICYNEKEMKDHEPDAFRNSKSNQIIIEEYVEGDEFTAHYSIVNKKVALSCVDNRYPVSVHSGSVTTVPVARVYPCLYLDEYLRQVNPQMLRLCESMGLTDAILFIQGIYNAKKNRFYIFEAGLRCAGEAPYRFISHVNGINSMNILVDHVLLGTSDYEIEREDPFMKGKCCGIISFVAKNGVVGEIRGLKKAIEATPSVIKYENRYPVGTQTPDSDTLRQLMIRFVMICDSRKQMEKDIQYLNENISILNDKGQNMVIKMEPHRIFDIK